MVVEPKAREDATYYKTIKFFADLIEKPVIWIRETIVEPNRKEYPWYHEQLRRVPTVDECYSDDTVCIFEADAQFILDREVDKNILAILRRRYEFCIVTTAPDNEPCKELYDYWQNATTNFFIKYGDLGLRSRSSKAAYMKQKHRMIWERRHGPVGSGMKDDIKTDE